MALILIEHYFYYIYPLCKESYRELFVVSNTKEHPSLNKIFAHETRRLIYVCERAESRNENGIEKQAKKDMHRWNCRMDGITVEDFEVARHIKVRRVISQLTILNEEETPKKQDLRGIYLLLQAYFNMNPYRRFLNKTSLI